MIVLGLIQKYQNHHGLWVLISLFAPLQGANNFLVYVRPKIGHAYRQWKLDRWKKQLEKHRRELERQARLKDDHQMPLDIASPEKRTEDGANHEAPQEVEEKIQQDSLLKPEETPVLQSSELQIPSFADDQSLSNHDAPDCPADTSSSFAETDQRRENASSSFVEDLAFAFQTVSEVIEFSEDECDKQTEQRNDL